MINYAEQANDSMIFLASQIQEQAELERYINEAILMSEGKNTIENMQVIQEGFIESVKNGLNKIAAFLKKMWNRFLEAMNSLIRTNKSYLDKYKDTILKNKIKDDVTYDMFNWKVGVPNLKMGLNMTYTNEEQLMKDFADKDAYIKNHFSNMLSGFKPPYYDEWSEICKAFFHGGQNTIEMKAADLTNMLKDMFDYCYNYESAVKNILQKDFDTFMANSGKQLDAIIKAQGSSQFKESANVWESAQYYSPIYEMYITEGDQNPKTGYNQGDASKQPTPPSPPTNQNNNDPNKPKTGVNNGGAAKKVDGSQDIEKYKNMSTSQLYMAYIDAEEKGDIALQKTIHSIANKRVMSDDEKQKFNSTDNNSNNDGGKLNVDTSKMDNADQLKQLGEAVQAYVNIGQVYLTNRMTAAEGAYKDYMKIMKEHVKDVVGNQNPAQQTAGAVKNDTTTTNQNQNGGNNNNANNNQQNNQNNNQNNNQQTDNTNGFK